jgi:hypothetical protein
MMAGNKLSNDASRRLTGALLKIPKPKPVRGNNGLSFDPFWVNLTGFSSGVYQWKRRYGDPANPGKFADFSPSITGDRAHFPGITVGNFIGKDAWIQFLCLDGSGNDHYVILSAGGLVEMQVNLTQTAGSDGNATTACSYTYTPTDLSGNAVKDASGTTLTAMSPTHNRPIGKTIVATQGVLVFYPDGSIHLRWTDEVPNKIKRSC